MTKFGIKIATLSRTYFIVMLSVFKAKSWYAIATVCCSTENQYAECPHDKCRDTEYVPEIAEEL
jgi:hypothetical protein